MNCKKCAYYDEDNSWCTHPEANVKIPLEMIDWPCRLAKEIEE